jgi:hypothetical protein
LSEWFFMGKRNGLLAVAVAAVVGGVGAAVAAPDMADSFVSYSGVAKSAKSDQFLYRENHVLHYRDGKIAERVVLYTCSDGSPFARKTVTYVDRLSPDFLLEDASNGMREGIRSDGGERQVFFRNDGVAPEKSKIVPHVDGLVADTGFDVFVRNNWQSLVSGQSLTMKFLVPSHLDDMGFKVKHVGSSDIDGTPVEVFRLELSGVLGWVLPSIDVYYSSKDHVLVRYVGPSDLRDASHDNFQATIAFPLDERKPGNEQAMQSARLARLAPCK